MLMRSRHGLNGAVASGADPGAGSGAPASVQIGPFHVTDTSAVDLVRHVVETAVTARHRSVMVFALHVGGLNSRHDSGFVAAMQQADIVYADGGSVVWLARLAGARAVERAATTDVGWDIIRALGSRLGRPARVALVGGPPGLAERAGEVLAGAGAADVVFTDHGYHHDWSGTLTALAQSAPDVTVVGLGAPVEMVWAHTHRDRLPAGLVLTCGGWFGHMVGDERRAPRLLRRSGLEWIARLWQSPRRLGPRYAKGFASTAVLSVETVRRRHERGRI